MVGFGELWILREMGFGEKALSDWSIAGEEVE